MKLINENRTFFVLFNNGDTFYFVVNSKYEIYCTKFKNIYESIKKTEMPGAQKLEFKGNSFCLKNAQGEILYSLEDYNKEMRKILPMPKENLSIERIYIDEDVRNELLSAEKITYDSEAVHIPGLLYEPVEQSYIEKVKTYKKTKQAINR